VVSEDTAKGAAMGIVEPGRRGPVKCWPDLHAIIIIVSLATFGVPFELSSTVLALAPRPLIDWRFTSADDSGRAFDGTSREAAVTSSL
jgi:hypothetical protein